MTGYYLLDHPNPNALVRPNGLRGHYYTTRTSPIRGIVAHTPETLEDYDGPDGAAEAVAKFLSTVKRAASIHACIDSDSIVPCLPDVFTAFQAGGVNSSTIGAEIGYAATSWRSMPASRVQGIVDQFAKWAAPRVVAYQLPLRVITDKKDWDKGDHGFLEHMITEDWRLGEGQTRRSDPGTRARLFPWDDVFEAIERELGRIGESGGNMANPRDYNAFVASGRHLGPLPSWAQKAWNWYVTMGGTNDESTYSWPTTRADISWALSVIYEPLTNAINAQQREIETLKARMASLEAHTEPSNGITQAEADARFVKKGSHTISL